MVVLDATMLMFVMRPDAGTPTDRAGKPVTKAKERIEFLVEELEKLGTKIVIPTPALAELLVKADANQAQQIVEKLTRQVKFRVEPFDERAAIELGAILRSEMKVGGKAKLKRDAATWAKVKFDRQIVAIARVIGATALYSDDEDVEALAKRLGMEAYRVCDLLLPPTSPQHELPLTQGPINGPGDASAPQA